jgi:hypothetical protein
VFYTLTEQAKTELFIQRNAKNVLTNMNKIIYLKMGGGWDWSRVG